MATIEFTHLQKSYDDIFSLPIEYLLKAISDVSLQKVIRLLPKYNINKISDLTEFTYDDLLSIRGLGKTKIDAIMQLAKLVYDQKVIDAVADYYERCIKVRALPSDDSEEESAGSVIKRFLKEYVNLFQELKDNKLVSNTFTRHCFVELAYLHDYTTKMIAAHRSVDVERVRQILTSDQDIHNSFIWQVRRMVKEGCTDNDASRILISDKLRKHLADIESFCRSCPTVGELRKRIGLGNSEEDRAVLRFIRHYTGAKWFGGECGKSTRIKEEFIVFVDIEGLSRYWHSIFLKLDDTVVPYAKEALLLFLQKQKGNLSQQMQDTIFNIIEHSNQFVKIEEGSVIKYQLHWKDLCSAQSQAERIIYEFGRPCSRREIIDEYNRRATIYELSPFNETVGIRSERDSGINRRVKIRNVVEYNAGGTWAWTDCVETPKTFTITNLVKKYMAEKEECSFDEVYQYVSKYITEPNERTIKTTLGKLCYPTSRGFYVYKESGKAKSNIADLCIATMEDITPHLVKIMETDKRYSYQELGDKLLINGHKVNVSKIRRCCLNHPEVFVITKSASRTGVSKISLNPSWSGEISAKESQLGRPKKSYRILMKECAINLLRSAENYTMSKREVVANIRKYLPEGIKQNNIYKIFDDPIFISTVIDKVAYLTIDKEIWEEIYQSEVESHIKQSLQELSDRPTIQNGDSADIISVGALIQVDFTTDRDMKNLGKRVKQELNRELLLITRDGMGIEDFETVWQNMIDLMNVSTEPQDSAYKRMLRSLYSYIFGKTNVDDRYFLFTEIRLCIEPYLKDLLKKIYPHDETIGLAKVIGVCQNVGLLPLRDDDKALSRYITIIINSRNVKGHTAEFTPSDGEMILKIKQALVICLYATSKYCQIIN